MEEEKPFAMKIPSTHGRSVGASIAVAASLWIPCAGAAATNEVAAPDPQHLDFFGSAVAASSNRVVASIPARYPALKGVVIDQQFAGGAWTVTGSFETDFHGDDLGRALALHGDLLLVGAPSRRATASSNQLMSGRAHFLRIQEDGSMVEAAHFSGSAAYERFGVSVAMDGQWAIVGAPGSIPPGVPGSPRHGAVRFFQDDGGAIVDGGTLRPASDTSVRSFGQSVAIAGTHAAASATLLGGDLPLAGTVHLFERDGADAWSIVGMLMAPGPVPGDRFGLAIAMKEDLLVVGAPAPGTVGDVARGAVYIYRFLRGQWVLEETILAPVDAFCEGFGRAVAIGEERVAVGAVMAGPADSTLGSVFLYRNSVPGIQSLWVPSGRWDGLADDDFGSSLVFAGTTLVIGAPGASQPNGVEAAGCVHLVDASGADLDGNGIVNGADLALLLGSWGAPQASVLADLNDDGVVDGSDLAILLGNWSQP